MSVLPTKNQLLKNFLSCISWEEKYIYIMDLGQLLPNFPDNFRTNKYLVTGCQSYTWIALINNSIYNKQNNIVKFYGDSNSAIVKGIIVIIFSLYQNLDIQSVINLDVKSFLDQLQLNQNLTISRSHGMSLMLHAIHNQANALLLKTIY